MAPPMQTQQAVRVGFELATDGIQIYVFANLDKTSLAAHIGFNFLSKKMRDLLIDREFINVQM